MAQVPSKLGTDALQRFIIQLFQVSETIDKNEDGKISGAEWGATAFELFLNFVSNKNLTNEVRDLDIDEVAALVEVVANNFPDYKNLRNEVEDVVRAALHVIASTVTSSRALFVALHNLNKKPEVPAVPEVPFVDNSGNPESPSMAKWTANEPEPVVTEELPETVEEVPSEEPKAPQLTKKNSK